MSKFPRNIDDQAHLSISDSAALLELSSILNASLDLAFILGNVLLTLMGKLMIPRGFILVQEQEWTFRLAACKGVSGSCENRRFILPVDWRSFLTLDTVRVQSNPILEDFVQFCGQQEVEILVPLIIEEHMVGVICLGKKITRMEYTLSELTFLESIAAVAASAISHAVIVSQLKAANRRLDTKVQELNTLFEVSREMNTSMNRDAILRSMSYSLMGQFRVPRFAVLILDANGLQAPLVRMPRFSLEGIPPELFFEIQDPTSLETLRALPHPLADWMQDQELQLLVPMVARSEHRGVLCLGNRIGTTPYDAADMEFLAALANITIAALENARLVQETIEKEKLEEELSLARSIQTNLFPDSLPEVPGYTLFAMNDPSRQVGGDYYDVIPLSDGSHLIAIADVSGKGIPASLIMANVQAALRLLTPDRPRLPELVHRINGLLYANTSADRFVTFFCAHFDPASHRVTYVNAGHNPPFLLRTSGNHEVLSIGGLILGILPSAPPYECGEVALEPGDALVLYTDGVTEALSPSIEEFGEERLLSALRASHTATADEIGTRILQDVHDFVGSAPQSDDITLVVITRKLLP